jgi:hypothetical protein
MMTDEQIRLAASETMVNSAAIRVAALTLCASPDTPRVADVIALTVRLLLEHPSRSRGRAGVSLSASADHPTRIFI